MLKRKAKSSEETSVSPTKKPQQSFAGTEPWKLVFNDARQAFTENKFKEAIALFTRALTLQPNQATILDCRAASYEKMNDLDLALADALTMIKTSPEDARGYLRAGKLFSLKKKYDKAISVYNRGLKAVDPKDARFTMIKTMKQKAERLARPPAKHDPVVVLPYDVFLLVFSYLSFDRRVQCTAVSKKWRSFALNWSGMWRDLELGGYRKISKKTVSTYLSYAKGRHVRSFTIHYANRDLMTHVIQCLINEDCQYIEYIDFNYCDVPLTLLARFLRLMGKRVKVLQLNSSNISTKGLLTEVISVCPALTHLSMIDVPIANDLTGVELQLLENMTHLRCEANNTTILDLCHNLKCLDLFTVFETQVPFISIYRKIAPTQRNLESITFSSGTGNAVLTDWKSTYSSTSSLSTTAATGQGLKTFEIYGDTSMNSQNAQQFLLHNPNIEYLTIADCYRAFSITLMEHITLRGLPNLKKLVLPRSPELTEHHLQTLATRCPLLEEIQLPMVINVTDTIMNAFATHTRKLRILDISDCNGVSGVGLQALVRAHRNHLEKLKINNCQRIGPDAVAWAVDLLGARVVECKYRVR